MRVSVVIPTWNGGERFQEVLDALAAQRGAGDIDLVVMDSESRDGTADRARRAGARVEVIPRETFNHGLTRNLGIAKARGELVLLLTQDAVPRDGWLEALVSSLEQDPRAAGAYGRQVPRPGGNPLLAWRLRQWAAGREEPRVQELAPGEHFDALAPPEKLRLASFDNVASCIRRRVWERHRFARRDFGEDLEWASRVVRDGLRIRFEPAAVVEHSHDRSIGDEFRRVYCDHQNLYELFGLRTVPDLRKVREGVSWGLREYGPILEEAGWGAARARWYIARYALAESLAQYLGARSVAGRRRSACWRALDRRMKRGIG